MSELTIAKYNHYIFHAILATVASIGYEPLRISHISSFFFSFFCLVLFFFFQIPSSPLSLHSVMTKDQLIRQSWDPTRTVVLYNHFRPTDWRLWPPPPFFFLFPLPSPLFFTTHPIHIRSYSTFKLSTKAPARQITPSFYPPFFQHRYFLFPSQHHSTRSTTTQFLFCPCFPFFFFFLFFFFLLFLSFSCIYHLLSHQERPFCWHPLTNPIWDPK